MVVFSDETIERLFGAEDAEGEDNERFKEYFFSNRAYENLIADLPIRLLVGHKGVGKSALLKRAYIDDHEAKRLAIWVQSNDISELRNHSRTKSFAQRIEDWKIGISKILYEKAAEALFDDPKDAISKIKASKNRSGLLGPLIDIVKTFAPENASKAEKVLVDNFLDEESLTIYIDDVDRGWTATTESIQNISALLNAVRDLTSSDRRIRCRIALRTDVYYLVRTSDESTDKIERHVIWLDWENHDILRVVAKRITTYFDLDIDDKQLAKLQQQQISTEILSRVIESVYQGAGHWANRPIHNVLLSLCRKRPKDLVKLFHGAARKAYRYEHSIIKSQDLGEAFQPYSEERLQDLINEFKSELPLIEDLLLRFRPSKRGVRTSESYVFKNDKMLEKLGNIISNTSLYFSNRKPVTSRSLLQFLYKIDFVTARRDRDDGYVDRKYFDQSRFLANESIDFGYDWEVHPAYRWALQPHDFQSVIDSISN